MTVSTGEASLIADLVPRTRIDLPPIPDGARAALLAELPTMGYVGNPLDPWGADEPATAYDAAFRAMAGSGAYDVLVLVHDFPYRSLPSEVETARTVIRPLIAATRSRPELLPVVVSLTSGEPTPEMKQLLDAEADGAPLLRGTVPAFAAIARVARWERAHERRLVEGPWRPGWPALAGDRTSWGFDPAFGAALPAPAATVLPERESLALLREAGIPTIDVAATGSVDEAVAAAERLGPPVALKVDAVGLAHKSESGAVRLGLASVADVAAAARALLALQLPPGATRRGLIVEPMAPAGVELIVGMRRDPLFGPALLVGLGGILAEALDDVAIRLAPVRSADALAMLDELRGRRLLAGARGGPAVDLRAVADIVVRLGRLAVARPELLEVDLNPVIATPDAAIAVDALVVVATER